MSCTDVHLKVSHESSHLALILFFYISLFFKWEITDSQRMVTIEHRKSKYESHEILIMTKKCGFLFHWYSPLV